MTPTIIDGEGNLIGRVNVVDAMVVLFFLAILLAGVSLFASGGSAEGEPAMATVTVEASVTQPVAVTIDSMQYATSVSVGEVGRMYARDSLLSTTDGYGYSNQRSGFVKFSVDLEVTERDGGIHYDGQRIYVGQTFTLDLGETVTKATVISVNSQGDALYDE